MITNTNESRVPGSGEFLDIKKFTGVGLVNVVAINPNNATLRKYGWSVPEGASEPEYVSTDKNGRQNTRIRLLVKIENHKDKPIVAMDFFIRKEFRTSEATGEKKVQVIDNYGRTAYVTQREYQAKEIPETKNGPAKISNKYRMCHVGESDLTNFLAAYLNVTPFEEWSRNLNKWVPTKDPGTIYFDNWDKLCSGDVSELKSYIAERPDNHAGVMFGVRTTQENKSYQAFITSDFLRSVSVNASTGEVYGAKYIIDKYLKFRENSPVTLSFSAEPIHEWSVSASQVTDNSDEDMPDFDKNETVFPNGDPF